MRWHGHGSGSSWDLVSFTSAGTPKRRIAPKAVARFKERVRELTRRTRGASIEQMAKDLARYLRGWIGYFGNCETPSVLQRLEKWSRRRLRSAIWKQWKHGRKRFAELRKQGVGEDLAAQTAGRPRSVAVGKQSGPGTRAAQRLL